MEDKGIHKTFLVLYFTYFNNSLLASLYNKLIYESSISPMNFILILTILKVVCPVFGGFIIDHVQYSLNLLLMAQQISILSYFYCIANCCINQEADEFLFFAIGFQVLAQQLQWVIIMSMICKQFKQIEIPKQLSYFFFSDISGRFVSFLLLLSIDLMNSSNNDQQQDISQTPQFLIYIIIIGVVQVSCTFAIYFLFPKIRNHAKAILRDQGILQYQFEEKSLLQAFKLLLNTDRAVIALIAGLIMGVIQIWQEYQDIVIALFFNQNQQAQHQNYQSIGYIAQELPYIISMIIAPILGIKLSKTNNKLSYLANSSTLAILFFFIIALVLLYQESIQSLKIILYLGLLIGLQYAYVSTSISSASLIAINFNSGEDSDFDRKYIIRQQTNGFSFGLMSMFNNLFQVWILSTLIAEINSKSIKYLFQILILCIFALCFTFIAFIITRVVQFVQQQKIEQRSSIGDAISLQKRITRLTDI